MIGQTVGNYKVTHLLGEGGMGIVYLAEHPVIGRKVAIKVLHISLSKDADIVARFFNEARAIHMIGHENIVEILDFGQTPDGQPYFIMEYLTGESLNDRVQRGPMPAAEVAHVADQICQALSMAHEKGIVHRDLKPHNVQLLTGANGKVHVKLLDFGVAKIMTSQEGGKSVKTRTGSLMGTPLYMSPEQCKGAGKLDHRTDIYSLGVMLYEMLAGQPPFNAEGVGELFAMHMLEQPPELLQFAPDTPPHMAAAVMRSLAKNLDDRYANMEEFRLALLGDTFPSTAERPAARGVSIRPTGAVVPSGMTLPPASTTMSSASSEIEDEFVPRRNRSGLAIVAVALAAAGVGAVIFLKRSSSEVSPPPSTAPANPRTPPPPPPKPAEPETVMIRFEADPAGVHVIRTSDDQDLGPVPVELKLPKDGGKPEFLFKLEGYKDKTLSTDLSRDRTLHVSLHKEPTATPPAPVVVPPPAPTQSESRKRSTPRPSRRTRIAPDEDGLATPNF